jgi:hypothetical protein
MDGNAWRFEADFVTPVWTAHQSASLTDQSIYHNRHWPRAKVQKVHQWQVGIRYIGITFEQVCKRRTPGQLGEHAVHGIDI